MEGRDAFVMLLLFPVAFFWVPGGIRCRGVSCGGFYWASVIAGMLLSLDIAIAFCYFLECFSVSVWGFRLYLTQSFCIVLRMVCIVVGYGSLVVLCTWSKLMRSFNLRFLYM